jgi:hypothetical protein
VTWRWWAGTLIPYGGLVATIIGAEDGDVDGAGSLAMVAAREEIDGFDTLVDLGEVPRLDVGLVEDLRPCVVFLPR